MDESDEELKKILSLKELIHSPVRLAVLMFLLPRTWCTFTELQIALNLTSGNLSTHLKKLEEGELIIISKKFVNRKPTTSIQITLIGQKALDDYVNELKDIIQYHDSTL